MAGKFFFYGGKPSAKAERCPTRPKPKEEERGTCKQEGSWKTSGGGTRIKGPVYPNGTGTSAIMTNSGGLKGEKKPTTQQNIPEKGQRQAQ